MAFRPVGTWESKSDSLLHDLSDRSGASGPKSNGSLATGGGLPQSGSLSTSTGIGNTSRSVQQTQSQPQAGHEAKHDKLATNAQQLVDDSMYDLTDETGQQSERISPTKVVHFRGLPRFVTEPELVLMCSPFGGVAKILLIVSKYQAFVEMETIEAATSLVTYYSTTQAILRNRPIYLQYSTRTELQLRTPTVQQVRTGNGQELKYTSGSFVSQTSPFGQHYGVNMSYGMTPSSPARGATMLRTDTAPRDSIQNQSGGAGQLHEPDTSNLTSPSSGQTPHSSTSSPGVGSQQTTLSLEADERPSTVLLVTILDTRVTITMDHLVTVFTPFGDVLKILIVPKGSSFHALVQYRYVESAINAKMSLDGRDMFLGCCTLKMQYSAMHDLTSMSPAPSSSQESSGSSTTPSFNSQSESNTSGGFGASSPTMGTGIQPQFSHTRGCVLLVSNLADEMTPDGLFTLFGVYGDVLRIKIFFNKKDTALIQFSDPHQAYLAHLHLNHVEVYGKPLSITPSKHAQVSLPHPTVLHATQQQSLQQQLTKDFTNSPLHRFRNARSKNYKHICPPSPVLHVSNLHPNASAEELAKLFGREVSAVQFFKTDRRMAFVRMASIPAAVVALIALHNAQLGGKHVRVSFSHKNPDVITDDVKQQSGAPGSGSPSTTTTSSSSLQQTEQQLRQQQQQQTQLNMQLYQQQLLQLQLQQQAQFSQIRAPSTGLQYTSPLHYIQMAPPPRGMSMHGYQQGDAPDAPGHLQQQQQQSQQQLMQHQLNLQSQQQAQQSQHQLSAQTMQQASGLLMSQPQMLQQQQQLPVQAMSFQQVQQLQQPTSKTS